MSTNIRKNWLVVHRWIGLTVGLLFVLLGLTGSVLVFDHAIDEWLNPDLLLTTESGRRRSVQDVIAAAESVQAAAGDLESTVAAQAVSVSKPRVENGVWTVWFSIGTEEQPAYTGLSVDPYTLKANGGRVWGTDLMSWLYRLHYQLVAGDVGMVIVGVIGIILMFTIVSGIILWWPLWKHSWRAAFAIRSGRRFQYDLHKFVGTVSAVFLLVIAFTGVYMEFPTYIRDAVGTFSETTAHYEPEDLKSADADNRPMLTADEAIATASKLFPDAAFDHLHPPQAADGFYEVAFRQPDEIQRSYGRTQVFIDAYSGEPLVILSPEDFTAADTFFAWQFPLHNGEAFGLTGRWVVFLAGITPTVLYVTGALVWWRRRRTTFSASNPQSDPRNLKTADETVLRRDHNAMQPTLES